jgi:hypothetical protein
VLRVASLNVMEPKEGTASIAVPLRTSKTPYSAVLGEAPPPVTVLVVPLVVSLMVTLVDLVLTVTVMVIWSPGLMVRVVTVVVPLISATA